MDAFGNTIDDCNNAFDDNHGSAVGSEGEQLDVRKDNLVDDVLNASSSIQEKPLTCIVSDLSHMSTDAFQGKLIPRFGFIHTTRLEYYYAIQSFIARYYKVRKAVSKRTGQYNTEWEICALSYATSENNNKRAHGTNKSTSYSATFSLGWWPLYASVDNNDGESLPSLDLHPDPRALLVLPRNYQSVRKGGGTSAVKNDSNVLIVMIRRRTMEPGSECHVSNESSDSDSDDDDDIAYGQQYSSGTIPRSTIHHKRRTTSRALHRRSRRDETKSKLVFGNGHQDVFCGMLSDPTKHYTHRHIQESPMELRSFIDKSSRGVTCFLKDIGYRERKRSGRHQQQQQRKHKNLQACLFIDHIELSVESAIVDDAPPFWPVAMAAGAADSHYMHPTIDPLLYAYRNASLGAQQQLACDNYLINRYLCESQEEPSPVTTVSISDVTALNRVGQIESDNIASLHIDYINRPVASTELETERRAELVGIVQKHDRPRERNRDRRRRGRQHKQGRNYGMSEPERGTFWSGTDEDDDYNDSENGGSVRGNSSEFSDFLSNGSFAPRSSRRSKANDYGDVFPSCTMM